MNAIELLQAAERQTYKELLEVRDKWIECRLKLSAHEIAKKIDTELIEKLSKKRRVY